MALSKRELNTALRRLANASTEVQAQRQIIHDHCMEVYGVDPSDVDNDSFIDACDGGAGAAAGMSAEEFHQSMISSMEKAS